MYRSYPSIQIGFFSIIQRTDNNLSNEIEETNIKSKYYWLIKRFIFVDNDNVNESFLKSSKLHFNKMGTWQLFTNILSSLDKIWYVTTFSIGSDITNLQLSASTSISKELKELHIENPIRLIFSYLNIDSIRNKFSNLQQGIKGSVDIPIIAETKIDSSFPTAQFHLSNYHTPDLPDNNYKGGGILVYIKSNIPICQLNCEDLCRSLTWE